MIHLIEWRFFDFQDFWKPVVTQVDRLKIRYYQQSTYLDQLARYHGEMNEFLKMTIKYLLIGASVFSLLFFNISLSVLLVLSAVFLSFLNAHYQVMEARFSQLSHDLDVSEKKLCQAVSKNLDLENQLSVAIQKNQEVSDELIDIKQEVTFLRQEIQDKERLIEVTRQNLEESSKKIDLMTTEILEIKEGVVEKAQDFLGHLSKSETLLQGLFKQSQNKGELKQSIRLREGMDEHLKSFKF